MDLIFVICVCICHAVYLVVTCWERSDLMALFYVMFFAILSLSHTVFLVR